LFNSDTFSLVVLTFFAFFVTAAWLSVLALLLKLLFEAVLLRAGASLSFILPCTEFCCDALVSLELVVFAVQLLFN
jgi:hypothetical protein